MGTDSQINTATGVTLGHSVGVGINSKIFTHGAYIDSFNLGAPVQWAPVSIGNNVWLPNAWVNPGVVIGDNVVVAAMSLINRDIPPGSLAGGIPVKILKENYLPRVLSQKEEMQLISLIENLVHSLNTDQNSDLVLKMKEIVPEFKSNNSEFEELDK